MPKYRLLGFKAADGWKLLYEFCGGEVPKQAYLHGNDSHVANRLMWSSAAYDVGFGLLWTGFGLGSSASPWYVKLSFRCLRTVYRYAIIHPLMRKAA